MVITTAVFETTPVGADTETTVAGSASGSGTIDLSVGETEIITFDFTNTPGGDIGVYSVVNPPAAGGVVVDDAAAGLMTFTITHAQWVAAGSPSSVSFSASNSIEPFPPVIYTLNITCFAKGTAISTADGATLVEELQIGDLVRTHDGRDVPVKWVGRQSVSTVFADVPESLQLVRVSSGALGHGAPKRELRLTTDHALLIDGVMVNAGALVGQPGISFLPLSQTGSGYTVYHVETAEHDVILAEGAPAETFLDAVSRSVFDNFQEYLDLYGEEQVIAEAPYTRISSRRLLEAWGRFKTTTNAQAA